MKIIENQMETRVFCTKNIPRFVCLYHKPRALSLYRWDKHAVVYIIESKITILLSVPYRAP